MVMRLHKRLLLAVLFTLGLPLGASAAPHQIATSDRLAVLEEQHGYYPCMDCHADQVTNPTPRFLTDEHDVPLEWTDAEGNQHVVPFGERVSFAQLLGETADRSLRAQNLARIGERLHARTYMEENGYTLQDSIYTLTHGGANIWCLDCHNSEDRNKLQKLNGEELTFNQSQLLCGQCHGPILTDWENGAHGRTNGYWNLDMDTQGATIRLLCVECHFPHAPAFPSRMPKPGPVSRLDNISHPDPHQQHRSQIGTRDDLGPHPWTRSRADSASADEEHH
jgi:uncharacterized CHY-type Zn-finger protein